MLPLKLQKSLFLFLFFSLAGLPLVAQQKIISGLVKDSHSEETIPFASVSFKNSTVGKLTDSSGRVYFLI
jgi:hypothetical protein